MSFITVLATSISRITYSENLMSKSFDKSVSAYYIAEAGIERSVPIIKKAVKMRIDKVLYDTKLECKDYIRNFSESETKEYLNDYIKTNMDIDIKDYFLPQLGTHTSPRDSYYYDGGTSDCYSFVKDINKYQANPGGVDTVEFCNKNGVESYYIIAASIDPADKRTVVITSEGHYEGSMRTITSKYYILDIETAIKNDSDISISLEKYKVYCTYWNEN